MKFIRNIIKVFIASLILIPALLMPYRMRVWYSEVFGKTLNFFYHAYVRLLKWFLRQLEG